MGATDGHGPWPAGRDGALRYTYADAEPVPFWLDSLAAARGATAARWIGRSRLGDRRGRSQRTLGGSACRPNAIPRAGSCSSSRGGSPTRRAVATAASARRFSPTGSPTGWLAFPRRCRRSSASGAPTSTRSRRRSRDTASTARLRPAATWTSRSKTTRRSGWLRRPTRCASLGHDVELLDRDGIGEQLRSPLPVAGLWRRSGAALVDPARLCWGLARVAEELGVRIHRADPDRTTPATRRRRLAGHARGHDQRCARRCWRPAPFPGSSARSAAG